MNLSRDQVREIDRRAIEEYGVPALVLMENAGRGAAELLLGFGIHGPVLICCGKGNNGGDGMVIARHLHNRGFDVHVHLFARPEELSAEAAVQWRIVERSGIPRDVWSAPTLPEQDLANRFAAADWLIDALFGTGLRGAVKPPFDRVIELMNASRTQCFALDIPSGLDCDTGLPLGPTIRASHTATFVGAKQGFANPAAHEWLGEVHVIDIGAPINLLKQYD